MILFSLTGCGRTADGQQEIRFSWWGGDSRHQATITAAERFSASHPGVEVRTEYGAWSGWEEAAAAALYAGTEADVMQVNRNWLFDYSSETAGFLDLRDYSDIIDLTQYDADVLDMCTADGRLLAVPVSRTGRVFLWNETTFEKAGLSVPEASRSSAKRAESLRKRSAPIIIRWRSAGTTGCCFSCICCSANTAENGSGTADCSIRRRRSKRVLKRSAKWSRIMSSRR
ncbi:MAG: carbohydrate ABC transporter substrate-binding protein [Oscillospiraceae bacterium]|nr:carbohydrate ABC transporter substrate-binding protein [Oscillospiraceae bacterium]